MVSSSAGVGERAILCGALVALRGPRVPGRAGARRRPRPAHLRRDGRHQGNCLHTSMRVLVKESRAILSWRFDQWLYFETAAYTQRARNVHIASPWRICSSIHVASTQRARGRHAITWPLYHRLRWTKWTGISNPPIVILVHLPPIGNIAVKIIEIETK